MSLLVLSTIRIDLVSVESSLNKRAIPINLLYARYRFLTSELTLIYFKHSSAKRRGGDKHGYSTIL